MMSRRTKTLISWQVKTLIFFCLVIFTSHFSYVSASRQYPQWDEHQYLQLAIRYYDILKHPAKTMFQDYLSASGARQPVYPLLIAMTMLIFGARHIYTQALILNGFWYVAMIVATYMLARRYFDRKVSLVAAAIAGLYGNALFYLHFTYSETALAACTTAALALLFRSEHFTKRKHTVLAGLMVGISSLVKWSAVAFLALPIVWEGIEALSLMFRRNKTKRFFMIKNISLFFLFGFVIPIFLYYLPNFSVFVEYVRNNQKFGTEWVAQYRSAEMANTLSIRSFMYYFNVLSQNTVYFMVLFAVGSLCAFIWFRRYAFLLLSLLSQYGFLTFIAVWKEDRFTVSMYPVMAVISVITFAHVRRGAFRSALIALTLFLAVLNFFGASWGIGPMGKRGLTDVVLPSFIKHPRRIYLTPLVWPPNKEYTNAHEIIGIIQKRLVGLQKPVVVSLFRYEPVDNAIDSIIAYERDVEMFIKRERAETDAFDARALLSDPADAVLIKVGGLNSTPLISLGEPYSLVGEVFVPIDGSTIRIYVKQ